MAEKWYHNLPPMKGKLSGWHHDEPTEERHRHLETSVRAYGYQPVIASLNRLRAFTNSNSKKPDPQVHAAATADEEWLIKTERQSRNRE